MKKIMFVSSLLAVSLFAKEEIVTPRNDIKLSLNDEAKVLVDCSYKEKKKFGFIGGKFSSKEYSSDENINSVLNIVCAYKHSQEYEIALKDLYNAAKTVVKEKDNDINLLNFRT